MSKIDRIRVPLFCEQKIHVDNAINSKELTHGNYSSLLSQKLLDKSGFKFITFTSNGNSALITSICALNLNAKRILIPQISTCYSMLNAIYSCSSVPVFVDVDENGNIDPNKAKELDFDGILSPNHFGTKPNFTKLKSFGKPIIEDACQDIFNLLKGHSYGDIAISSFYPTKILNGIDGGAVFTNNKELISKVNTLAQYDNQLKPENSKRFNFRFNNINAAFAYGTLVNMDKIETRYMRLLEIYTNKLTNLRGMSIVSCKNKNRTKILIRFENQSIRDNMYLRLIERGIGASKELVALTDLEHSSNSLLLMNSTLSLPFYYDLGEYEVEKIIRTLS
ncbi:DegT/DnrJ/EryC1/StrS family aminotransferase [Akkermansiaceae bacterium]|nr:DegT/DnrJ/EryC1/StrS family aminotransferase [Akkermansiaceae bacterium]